MSALTTALTMTLVGALTAGAKGYVIWQGRKRAGRDGDAIVLRYGVFARTAVVGLCIVLGFALPVMLIYMRPMASAGYLAVLWVLAGCLCLFGILSVVEIFSRQLFITTEAIVSVGVWGTRTILYEEVVAIKDETETVRIKVSHGRLLTISKSMPGWSEGVGRIRARSVLYQGK